MSAFMMFRRIVSVLSIRPRLISIRRNTNVSRTYFDFVKSLYELSTDPLSSKMPADLTFLVRKNVKTVMWHPRCYFSTESGGIDSVDEENDDLDGDLESLGELLNYDISLYRQHRIPGVGHNVVVIQPRVKWGPQKKTNTTPELQLSEAATLIETLPDWHVVGKMIVPVTVPMKKQVFGTGNLEKIKAALMQNSMVSAVFISCNILTSSQQKELEKHFGLPVFDRMRLRDLYEKGKDREGGGNRFHRGSGESFLDIKRRLLMERETKIRRALDNIRKKRNLLLVQRSKKDFPVVAIVGYTNSGKTSLIKALTEDASLEPKDQLFATLDVTAHGGLLPSHQKVLYIDTVGFISDIPTTLIESFRATLEDVTSADLLIHIRDVSHPDQVAQKDTVLQTLSELQLPEKLITNIIEVGNKIDLVDRIESLENEDMYFISATEGKGILELKHEIEERILNTTGRMVKTFRVPMGGEEARWLYRESGVKSATACHVDPNFMLMQVVITETTANKFKSYFGDMMMET